MVDYTLKRALSGNAKACFVTIFLRVKESFVTEHHSGICPPQNVQLFSLRFLPFYSGLQFIGKLSPTAQRLRPYHILGKTSRACHHDILFSENAIKDQNSYAK